MTTVSQIKNELADREAIKDCLYRYCRGTDRGDAEIIKSAYWPGAMDYHTGFTGTVEQFCEWALPRLNAMQGNAHLLSNIIIRLDGNKAGVETYFWAVSILGEGPTREVVATGRYVDKFEKRNDEWRIAERTVVHDYFREYPDTGNWKVGPFGMADLLRGSASKQDKSYEVLPKL